MFSLFSCCQKPNSSTENITTQIVGSKQENKDDEKDNSHQSARLNSKQDALIGELKAGLGKTTPIKVWLDSDATNFDDTNHIFPRILIVHNFNH